MSRTKQSIKNASFSLICQGVQLVFQLITRVFFIRIIGREYLGLNGLFTDLLTALQLVELGIGPAIAFSLYKPLAENDKEKVKTIMDLFKKAYRVIGAVVFALGLIFLPIYPYLIKDIPNIENLNLIYMLFVFNTSISYFYSYYRTLLISDQKKYIDISIQTGITLIYSIAQILTLYFTHNYIYYLLLQISGTILINFIASKIALKEYPYLKEKDVQKLDNNTSKEIKKNVLSMVFHKVGSIVRDSTDNLLISKFIGLAITGLYSNYSMITKALTNIVNQIFAAVVSSVGNLHVTRSAKSQRKVFYKINYINFWIATFCACCFGGLINSFIIIIADESYLLGIFVTASISLKFYLDVMRKTPWMFCEAAGIYWQGKTKPIWEVIVNLVVSVILVKFIGMCGIFVGTIITILTVDLTIEPYLAFKYVLKDKPTKYYKKYTMYLIIAVITYIVNFTVCNAIGKSGIIWFIIKAIISVIIVNGMIIVFTFKTKEFQYVKKIINDYKNKILSKIK